MNLHGIVANVITAVNPLVPCMLQMSNGYNIAPDGSQVPTYAIFADLPCQIQAMSSTDLRKTDALNIQGIMRAAYLNGSWEGLNRSLIKGGDILTMPPALGFPGPTTWLVGVVLEHWPDWTKLALVLQNGS